MSRPNGIRGRGEWIACLESAKVEFDQVQDVVKLYKTAVRAMINTHKAERAFVACGPKPARRPTVVAVYGLESARLWADESIPGVVLTHVLEKARPVFTSDTHENNKFCFRGRARAVACNPIVDLTGAAVGLLYCDHSRPGGLDAAMREAMKELAKDFTRRYWELAAAERFSGRAASRSGAGGGLVGKLARLWQRKG